MTVSRRSWQWKPDFSVCHEASERKDYGKGAGNPEGGQLPDASKIPAVRFDVAKELVAKKYNRQIRNPFDLEPEEEALIGQYFKGRV